MENHGIGKSTLILQICDKVKGEGKVLYVSGEESAEQIKIRADRLGINNDDILFLGETDIEVIEDAITRVKPKLVIIDSIQTMYSDEITSSPGSVDTVLYLEGERYFSYRILRGVKNRFGSTNEIGMFEMQDKGMVEIQNPSSVLLGERDENPAGSIVVASMEGTRPIMVELQALTSRNNFWFSKKNCKWN